MNLDELKAAWQEYDQKLRSTQIINEKIIFSMIKERSRSRLSKIRRDYLLSSLYMCVIFAFFIAILIGNPFDFKYKLQYLPFVFYAVASFVIVVAIIKGYMELNIDIHQDNLDAAIKKIIENYAKAEKIIGRKGLFLMLAAFLCPISFAPPIIEHVGLWMGIAIVLLQMSLVPVEFLIAKKLGAFKERHSGKLKEDLQELNELKSISATLN